MEYVHLTGCGLSVSRICLGTMTMGDQVDEKAAREAVDYALDRGVNFFDTASIYTDGRSEAIMGKVMAGRRDRFILATKAGLKGGDGPNETGLSRHNILQKVDAALRRLGTDYIDMFYFHTPDYHTPIEESLATVDALIKAGKIRYLAASNYAAWQFCQMRHAARDARLSPPVAAQMVYNLVTRGIEQELIPFLKEYRMGLVVYNPLAGGLLTDKYADKHTIAGARLGRNDDYNKRYWNEDNLAAWDAIHRIASGAGIAMAELATRWLLSTGNVDSVITGFSSLEQLKQNIAAAEGGPLSPDVMAACDDVWEKLAGTRFRYNR